MRQCAMQLKVKDPDEKLVTAETMQKGIKNIVKLMDMHKNNKLDYLTVSD